MAVHSAEAGDGSPARLSFGKYEIVRVLGSGGMGVLYEARHPVLANRLAIKTLHPGSAADGAERFRNEALAASRLRDDRLPQVFDIDQLDDGTLYIVMEYLEGEDLHRRLARGALDVGYSVRVVFELLELLARVHTLGIVHRDVKPANIFLARSTLFGEIPKLLDFGVAHIAANTLTRAGQVLGTPAYMAPEQVLAPERIGPWTDIFAAAVVLFELIAGPGERPWVTDPGAGLVPALSPTPPRPLTTLAPWSPPGLWEAIDRALRREPDARYRDALEFARAIEPFAADRSVLYQAVPAEAQPAAPSEASSAEATVAAPAPRMGAQAPLVATKMAELRNAFARRRPSAAPTTPHREERLQPGERRLVAVICAHLQLDQSSGPPLSVEDRDQLLSQFLDLFGQVLSDHGARVVGQPDGGLVGVFGGEHVREDDAEQAIAAALALGARRDEASALLADLGSTLTTRVGIHRGFVPQRARTDAPLPVGGETFDLAHRVSERAPLNGILATGDAVEGLRERLAVRPFARLTLPGRPRPVETCEVIGTARGGEAAGPPFIGREAALVALRDALDAAAEGDAPVVAVVSGPPGIGKSRLIRHFLADLEGRSGGLLTSVRVEFPARVSYGLWASLVAEILARIDETTNLDRGERTAIDVLAAALDEDRGALLRRQGAIIDNLAGRGGDDFAGHSPQEMGERIHLAVTLCLDAASRLLRGPQQPLVVVLDNLHRADPASLSLLARVVGALRTAAPPLVLLGMRAALPGVLPRHARFIELGPLSAPEAAALVLAVAAPAAAGPALRQIVAERAGGNPLFVEQLVATLREEGRLGASETDLRGVATPVSLYGLFLERVDRLETVMGDALRVASVLGTEFERDVFLSVSERALPAPDGADRWPGTTALDELVARGFLTRRESPAGGQYAFEQTQMQAAVYGTVLVENRQLLHRLAAEALEQFHIQRPGPHLERILHHYSQSGSIERTVHYARLAGERALALAAYDEAGDELGIAAALQDRLAETTDLAAAETLHRLATAFEWRGQLRQAAARAEDAAARLARDPRHRPADGPALERQARIAMTLGEVYGLLGSWQRSIEAYADAERCFLEAGFPVEAAEARCCRGFSWRARGQPEQGVDLATEGWAALELTGHQPAIARAGHELGNLLRDLGRYDEARRIFDRAVEAGDDLRRLGRLSESMWGSIASRSGRAMTHAAAGDLEAAVADQLDANDLARRDGNRVAETITEYHLAAHHLDRGDLEASAGHAERAHRQAREMDMPGRAFKSRVIQARIGVHAGHWAEALARIRDAFAEAERDRIPEDALVDAVELLCSLEGRAAREPLAQAARLAWPHVSHRGGDRLREAVESLSSLLGADDGVTRNVDLPEGDDHAR